MLLRWDVENPNQLTSFLTPENQWNGCTYTESAELPTARTQEGGVSRSPELIGNAKAKEDFLKDVDPSQLLCDAGVVEACVSQDVGATPSDQGPTESAQESVESDDRDARREARRESRRERRREGGGKGRRKGRGKGGKGRGR